MLSKFLQGNTELEELLQQRDVALKKLREQLVLAQNRMKKATDLKRREIEFQVGEWVYLKLCPYRQKSLARRENEKLALRYVGPYEVIRRIGLVAYKLDIPLTSMIHPFFMFPPQKGYRRHHPMSPIPASLTKALEWVVESDSVLDERDGAMEKEFLVRWKHLPEFEATWEPLSLIQAQFPDFPLSEWGKLKEDGNDTSRFHLTYVRRKKRPTKNCHLA